MVSFVETRLSLMPPINNDSNEVEESLVAIAGYRCISGPSLDQHVPVDWNPGDLVWVLKSKGRKSKAAESQRKELFLRGCIVSSTVPDLVVETPEQPRRLLIQYPQGSTYHVKEDNLLRILTPEQQGWILVWPETNLYRRSCLTHTTPDQAFCEIGCDHGATVHRLASCCTTNVLGVDKAADSIASARKRHPQYTFIQWDCLQADATVPDELRNLIQSSPTFHLAMDIGGNRELPAVLACLHRLLVDFALKPRLVFVKSRALFQEIEKRDKTE